MLPPHPYGSAAVKASQLEGAFTQRRSLNLVVVFSNLALPWAAFGLVFWALAFWPHFEHPICAWSLLLFHLAIALVSVLAAFRWSSERAAYWYRYFAGAILVSVLVASLLGSLTYQYTMKDAYTLTQHLKMYKDVDVGQAKGQQMMDAGLVAFETSSGLDLRKSQGFRDGGKTYCVAPITNGQGSLPVYDFWAVGVDCCSSIRADFRCGQYDQPRAHAGIRWLSASERPHFKLAVQAAEATHQLRSAHPLFFEWVEDPVDELNSRRSRGYQFFLFCLMAHFGVSLTGVMAAIFQYASLV